MGLSKHYIWTPDSQSHDNFENGPVPVGSTVNIHCPDAEYENEFGISEYIRNKRIDRDKWDGGKMII